MEQGNIIEQGNHEKLLKKGGACALMIFEEMKRKEAAKIAFIGMNPIGVKLA